MQLPTLPTCGECRHWGLPGETYNYRRCLAIIHDKSGHTASTDDGFETDDWLDEADKEEIRNIRKAKAVCVDGSGYHAAVKCRADFGCVLFEEKTK